MNRKLIGIGIIAALVMLTALAIIFVEPIVITPPQKQNSFEGWNRSGPFAINKFEYKMGENIFFVADNLALSDTNFAELLTENGVSIGGNIVAANVIQGSKLQINSNDSMIVPVGTSAQRPGSQGYTDVAGMLRYNTTLTSLEFYDGSAWQGTGSTFTVINSTLFSLQTGNPSGNVDAVVGSVKFAFIPSTLPLGLPVCNENNVELITVNVDPVPCH
ncbi:MAG: hypothetical protein EB167_06840, partial [Nitrososphaeria archaeon]|nr:hypothetical protein [Nitrososphaeria archaeon]